MVRQDKQGRIYRVVQLCSVKGYAFVIYLDRPEEIILLWGISDSPEIH